ncbi:MAG: CinA family nicotinamide mononucleotide deamidase-related protein [Phycisphaerales bacterium]|nr:CinA family nicotinamide mononucleotide deamidase-related protein [Phycisphaerales bacterium]
MSSRAAILTIGDELILGDRFDTNGPWLSRELIARGIPTAKRISLPDDVDAVAEAVHSLSKDHALLLITGGLGPTEDDRTREAFALSLNESLIEDSNALASIESWFATRNAVMPMENRSQAFRPPSANWIQNNHGTAPGLLGTINQCTVVCLPGPPAEMQPMFYGLIEELQRRLTCCTPRTMRELHAWGLPESLAGERIADLMKCVDPVVSVLMHADAITARVSSEHPAVVDEAVVEISKRWAPFMYGVGETTLAKEVGRELLRQQYRIATAESCTAGLLSSRLAEVEGSSAWLQGGWVTYTNELKQNQLEVPRSILEEHGAVSWQVAASMARGAAIVSGSDVALSTTGIAGPTGGSVEKPVGTVFIGCNIQGNVTVRRFCFAGSRNEIRLRASNTALQMLRFQLLAVEEHALCSQQGSVIHAD